MRLREEKQAPSGSDCENHEWQPLFVQPADACNQRRFMSEGHGDYLTCVRCGAVGLRDGASASKLLTLSASFSDAKRRQAAAWNDEQTKGKP